MPMPTPAHPEQLVPPLLLRYPPIVAGGVRVGNGCDGKRESKVGRIMVGGRGTVGTLFNALGSRVHVHVKYS